jgi:hypothetical protein
MNVSGLLHIYDESQVILNGGSASVGSLIIDGGGLLDVNSYLLIDYGTKTNPESAIQQYIQGGAIVSDLVNANPQYGIAYADAGDSGLQDPNLQTGQAIIQPALLGDAELEGTVSIQDLQDLLNNFNAPGFWDQGNFNGHATVDISDLQALLANFNNSATLSDSELTGLENLVGEFGDVAVPDADGNGFLVVSVPEPASVGVVICVGAIAMRRRRQRGRR